MNTKLFTLALAALLMCGAASMQAQTHGAKYCKNFAEFSAGQWTPVSTLIKGDTKSCELKVDDNEFKFKTGDKDADKVLKKESLVVEYGGHLYVNCRNLNCEQFSLDINNYSQAYRYGGGKLLVVAYHISDASFLGSLAGDIIGLTTSGVVSAAASVGSSVAWYGSKNLKGFRCYLLSKTDEEGDGTTQGLDDEFMEKLLADSPALLKSYKSAEKKSERYSASHILPLLRQKGLIHE